MMRYPIYIPSLGRYGKTPTTKLLDKHDIPYFIVAESHEVGEYKKFHMQENVLDLGGSGFGDVAPARNFCKRHATKCGSSRHWQLDDDIFKIVNNVNGKAGTYTPDQCLSDVEDFVDAHLNIAVASLAYTTFGFMQKKPYLVNKGNASCMLFDNRIPHEFRRDTIQDYEYSLQVLKAGWCTVVFYKYLIHTSSPESLPGGCTEVVHSMDKRLLKIKNMHRYHPELTKIVHRFGKPRINFGRSCWGQFKQRLRRRGS